MSFVLVISLPLLAHSSGKFLRQGKEKHTYYYLLAISVTLVVAISWMTAELRKQYLVAKGIPIQDLQKDFFTFFIIGIILYFVGLIISYFAHDESIEFTEVYKRFHTLKKEHRAIESQTHQLVRDETERYMNQKEQIIDRYNAEKQALSTKIDDLNQRLNDIISSYDMVLNYYKGLELKMNNYCNEAIQKYRYTNHKYRTNHAQPISWKKTIPTIEYSFQDMNELSPNPSK